MDMGIHLITNRLFKMVKMVNNSIPNRKHISSWMLYIILQKKKMLQLFTLLYFVVAVNSWCLWFLSKWCYVVLCYWLGLCNGAQIKTDNNLEEHIDQGNLLAQRGFQCILCVKLLSEWVWVLGRPRVRYDFICVRKGFLKGYSSFTRKKKSFQILWEHVYSCIRSDDIRTKKKKKF